MPILYPDLGIAGLIYFKRIRANYFLDLGQTSYTTRSDQNINKGFSSSGAELIFDLQFLNIQVLYSILLRYSYLLQEENRNLNAPNGVWEIGIPIVRIE